ncbi:homocysteine-responsive endoplasmic reticulum-resident ubiquitin-like domain member 2 protein [Teleopsis dalmanni]|uniref:homocysteine-responsive endoplasmic reticulum-resident ubiquitin-like domain member 2 protein n=1 Tax=Teleopsis dalmanni TaxID=139649 RepID=UPI0018CD221B|nr:homocysteine-responsive endoplasmic reticulum-resident ubiquitin-like domain member 2 protein [Teleopsis dalmanni]
MDKPTTSTSSSSAVAVADGASAAASSKVTATSAATTTTVNSNVTSVKLLIKASNQLHDDQVVESDLLWTVQRLKMQLSLVYPSQPPVAEQKLIYSGQLLNDKLLLKDVIRSYKDVYTQNHIFHLVYTPASVRSPPPQAAKSIRNNTMTSNRDINTNMASTNMGSATDGLRHRNVYSATQPQYTLQQNQQHSQQDQQRQNQQTQQQQQQQQSVHQPQPWAGYYANAPQFNPHIMPVSAAYAQAPLAQSCPPFDTNNPMNQWTMQVMATQQAAMYNWMQHVYSQYMDRCIQVSNASQNNTTEPTIPINHAFQAPYGYSNFGVPLIPNPSAFNINAHQPQNQMQQSAENIVGSEPNVEPVDVQAQERPEAVLQRPRFPNIVQEEQENRDWLDRFFSITRLAFFLTILYFNSSPLRCLAVVFIAGGIYLNHIGVFRFRPERNNNNINRNNNDQIRQGVEEVQQAQAQAAQEIQNESASNTDPTEENSANRSEDVESNATEEPAVNAEATDEEQPQHASSADTPGDDAEPNAAALPNVGVLTFVRTFVLTFFASLLPETPAL